MHKHPEIEQTYIVEGSFYDHDGICRAGEFVWRRVGSFHKTHSDEGAVILAVHHRVVPASRQDRSRVAHV
jgi:anti-sigma factor ChrR (cupin superfamily)